MQDELTIHVRRRILVFVFYDKVSSEKKKIISVLQLFLPIEISVGIVFVWWVIVIATLCLAIMAVVLNHRWNVVAVDFSTRFFSILDYPNLLSDLVIIFGNIVDINYALLICRSFLRIFEKTSLNFAKF